MLKIKDIKVGDLLNYARAGAHMMVVLEKPRDVGYCYSGSIMWLSNQICVKDYCFF